MMGKKLEVIYICLACFLPLFFSSPACISGFPQLLSKPVPAEKPAGFPRAAMEVCAGRVTVLAFCCGMVPHLAWCEGIPGWHTWPAGHPVGSSLVGEK